MTDPYGLDADNAIAIIGFSFRLPGISDEAELWDALSRGRVTLTRYDADRLRALGFDPALLSDPRYVPVDGRLPDADRFDPEQFGISQREAELADPQHRLLLECGWEVLQRTGYGSAAHRPVTGVFAGASMNTYLPNVLRERVDLVSFAGTEIMLGNDKDYMTPRLSYKLGLTGPAITVQTGCSSSLVAVHLAIQSLLAGECDLALAGGVSVHVGRPGYLYEPGLMFSPDGQCRAFDADAAGTPFGDGVGLVALRRLSDALDADDPIRAVIRGSATNNDGARRVGFSAPSVDGQRELIAEAQAVAGVGAAEIGLVEAHGTGTPLGDPIEFRALCEAFSGVPRGGCALGAFKANIGHLAAAAGVAGLLKATLAVERGEIPPHPTFRRPHPALGMEDSPFFVNARPIPWPRPGPRFAGVSSFGVGGSNAHVVLQQAPPRARATSAVARGAVILPLSARTAGQLDDLVERTARFLAETDLEPEQIAATLQLGREAGPARSAAVGRTQNELASALRARPPAPGRAATGLLLVPGRETGEAELAAWTERCGAPVAVARPWSPARVEGTHVVVCLAADPALVAEVAAAARAVGAPFVEASGADGVERSLAAMFAAGLPVRWPVPEQPIGRRSVPHPRLERRRCWVEPRAAEPDGPQASAAAERSPEAWLYAESWTRIGPLRPAGAVQGPVWILEDEPGIGAALAERLAVRGVAALRLPRHEAPEARSRRLADAPPPSRLVCTWALGPIDPIADTRELYEIATAAAQRGATAIDLVGAGLFDVTGAEQVEADRAAVAGLGVVLGQEGSLACRTLDLDPASVDAESIERWLSHPTAEGTAALRAGQIWLQRFVPSIPSAPPALTPGGTCLVTGGTGSVGSTLGEALARRYDLRLLLVGRAPLPPREQWPALLAGAGLDPEVRARVERLHALDRSGIRFEVLSADVADPAALDGVLARGEALLGPIRSFVHAAGPSASGASIWGARIDGLRWREGMVGKIEGARHLHERLGRSGRLELGVFVSSLAAIAGGIGLGAYAASNRFLDGLVQQHRDLPYLALDWEGWTTWGDAANLSRERRSWALTPAEAAEAFALSLSRADQRRIAISRVPLERRARPAAAAPEAPPPAGVQAVAPVEATDDIGDVLAHLWTEVLKIEVDPDANFFDLGGDSLLGVELVRRINQALGTDLVISDVFDTPSVRTMAEKIQQGRQA